MVLLDKKKDLKDNFSDFSFLDYPTFSWIKNYVLTPSYINDNKIISNIKDYWILQTEQSFHAKFITLQKPGNILIKINIQEWIIKIDIRENDEIIYLHNGIIIFSNDKKSRFELFIVKENLLIGKCINRSLPEIKEIKSDYNTNSFKISCKKNSTHRNSIISSEECFLIEIFHGDYNKENKEESFLINYDEFINEEFNKRISQYNFLEKLFFNKQLSHLNHENLLSLLRPSNDHIPGMWTHTNDGDCIKINDFLIIIEAWSSLNVDKSIELIKTLFMMQLPSGQMPSLVDKYGIKYNYAPRPIIINTLEKIYLKKLDNKDLLYLLPKINKYIKWALKYYSSQKKEIPRWQHEEESIIKKIFSTEVSTVDVTALLLREIKSYRNILSHLNQELDDELKSEFDHLLINLNNLFWNPETRSYTNAIGKNNTIEVKGFLSFIPLITNEISVEAKEGILEKLKSTKNFSSNESSIHFGMSIVEWRKIDLFYEDINIFQKKLFFEALSLSNQDSILYEYIKITLNELNNWYKSNIELSEYGSIPGINSAYVVLISELHLKKYQTQNKQLNRLISKLKKAHIDHIDIVIVLFTIIGFLGVIYWNTFAKTAPPLSALKTEIDTAYNNYDINKVIKTYLVIQDNYPKKLDQFKVLIANISTLEGNLQLGEDLITEIRNNHPDSPGPMITHALILHMKKDYKNADKIYFEFCYLFDEIFPELVQKIKVFKFLLNEKLPLPKNWREIYKFKMLHEI